MTYNLFEMCDRAIRYISETRDVDMGVACDMFIVDYHIQRTKEICKQMDEYLKRFRCGK